MMLRAFGILVDRAGTSASSLLLYSMARGFAGPSSVSATPGGPPSVDIYYGLSAKALLLDAGSFGGNFLGTSSGDPITEDSS